jgi:radical SAM protein with 4Fe4S-binding SPASM domain
VSFSGGEPLLYDGWEELVRRSVDCGLETAVVTNGTLLNDRNTERLASTGATVALSIDGACEETHDRIRGRGSFAKTRAAMRRLAAHGMRQRVIVCFTPMKPNIRELPALVSLLAGDGFRHLYISALESRGREVRNAASLWPDTADRVDLLGELADLTMAQAPAVEVDTGHLRYFFSRLYAGWDGTGDPIEGTARVSPSADVFLTAYVDDERFRLGSLVDASLAACWFSRPTRDLLAAAASRAAGEGACRDCAYWLVCGGGSTARAFAQTGSFASPDEFCEAKVQFLEQWFQPVRIGAS